MLFCDLRGFTAFTETNEPEEVMGVLSEYHREMWALIDRYEGTIERFAGDGIIALFNDPCPASIMRNARCGSPPICATGWASSLIGWSKRGLELGCGIGIALGYATLGTIGFERRLEYSAIGSVMNLASRLCDEAKAGQIVMSRRVFSEVERMVEAAELGALQLKGFSRPVPAYELIAVR